MKPPYAIGSVPSLSGHAVAYRWRSLPRVRRHRASKPQGSSERVLPWQITMDWRAAKRALQYLWRTKDVGITYGGTPGPCKKLSAWVNADFATCPDTRRSVSGGEVMLGEGAISWLSRVQKVTAAASSESGYVALAEVVNELRFVRQVKGFLTPPINDNIIIKEGNEGAIKMATNRFSSKQYTGEMDSRF